jgi:hypothetical protein
MTRSAHRLPKIDAPGQPVAVGEVELEIPRTKLLCWGALLVAAAVALIWKHRTGFYLSWTDEQIHYYVARRMAEGAVLYRDIDSARPPLVLFPVAWLIRAGCSPLLAGRALVFSTQLATAGLLVWGGGRLVSWRVGALAALLFLTSPHTFNGIHYTGIHLAAFTAAACVLFSLREQPFLAGLCLGAALAADQHGLAMCALVALITIRRPRDALAFALGAASFATVVFGAVLATGSRHLWASLVQIHLFHLQLGQGAGAQFWEQFTPWLYEHGYLFLGGGLAIVRARRPTEARHGKDSGPRSSKLVTLLSLVIGGHIALVLAMTDAAFLYIVAVAPLLALLAAIGFDAAAAVWLGRRQLPSLVPAQRSPRVMLAQVAAVVTVIGAGWAAARAHREALDERPYSFWPYVLHGQVSRFHQLDVVGRIASDRVLPSHGTLFGDPTIVSAVALQSGLRVSAELADLNPAWMEAGTIERKDVVERIERDGVAAVITPPWFLIQDPYFRSYLMNCYQKPLVFPPPESGPGAGLPEIIVLLHNQSPTPCQAPSSFGG